MLSWFVVWYEAVSGEWSLSPPPHLISLLSTPDDPHNVPPHSSMSQSEDDRVDDGLDDEEEVDGGMKTKADVGGYIWVLIITSCTKNL